MGQDSQSGSSRMLTFCLSNYASLTDMFGTGCIINTLDLYNFIAKPFINLWQCISMFDAYPL